MNVKIRLIPALLVAIHTLACARSPLPEQGSSGSAVVLSRDRPVVDLDERQKLLDEESDGFVISPPKWDPAGVSVGLVEASVLTEGDDVGFVAPCLSQSLEEWSSTGAWCKGEPRIDGPRIAKASAVRISSRWVLTTIHGVGAVGRTLRVVTGLSPIMGCPRDPTKDGATPTWRVPEASVHPAKVIHCIPALDAALIAIGDDDEDVPEVKFDSETVKKLRGETAKSVPVTSVGFPLGIPGHASLDGHVHGRRAEEGGHLSTVDDFNGSSGSPIFHHKSEELLGLVVGASKTVTVPTKDPHGCWRLPWSSSKKPNARVALLTEDEIEELKACESARCQKIEPSQWNKDSCE